MKPHKSEICPGGLDYDSRQVQSQKIWAFWDMSMTLDEPKRMDQTVHHPPLKQKEAKKVGESAKTAMWQLL